MTKRKSKIKQLDTPEHKRMQLKAAENALADVERNVEKYLKSKRARIASLKKLIAELREELGEC